MDLIEEMTEKEKEIYKDKPTILNAILTPIKASHRQKYINIDGPMAEELLKEIPDTDENKEIIELLNNIIEQEKKEIMIWIILKKIDSCIEKIHLKSYLKEKNKRCIMTDDK